MDLIIWFCTSLVACILLTALVPAVHGLKAQFAGYVAPRVFPGGSSLEHNKFALIRIPFGLILLVRGLGMWALLLDSERFSAVGYQVAAETLAGALLSLEILAQWALVFLVGAMWQFSDFVTAKETLGNNIGAMLAVLPKMGACITCHLAT